MKGKFRVLIVLGLSLFLLAGYILITSRVRLVLDNKDFNHKAYSFVEVEEFFSRVDKNNSKYEKLDIFIIDEDNNSYNIDLDIENLYSNLALEVLSRDLIPVTKDFKIKYVASNRFKSIEKFEDISLIENKDFVIYDYQKDKVLSDNKYVVQDSEDLNKLLNFKAHLLRFDQERDEIDLDYKHKINLDKNGDYSLEISNKDNNINKEVIVTVKKLEEKIEEKSEEKLEAPMPETPKPPQIENEVTGKLKNINVLVNKKYHLGSGDVPPLVSVPANYALNSSYLAQPKAVASFVEMVDAMQAEINKRIIIASAYRSFQYQKDLFNRYVARDGLAAAERYSARPGQSEHQTGLAIDVSDPNDSFLNFGASVQSQWINNNAHRYGFIVRYEEGREQITGYMPEPWHLRYLEPDLATKVYNSKLTYDEYYLAYLQ